jgi:hypothetical protein
MKNGKPPEKPVRWYAPTKKVLARLLALGVPKGAIYDAEKGETWDKITMRHGESLGVLDGLRGFGGKRSIKGALARFHDQGATVVDIETGQDSRTHGVAMYAEATSTRRKMPESEKLARAEARRKKDGKMLKRDAYEVWRGIGTVEQKEEATGWSRAALYAEFGKTGAPAGRPPKAATT